MGVSPRIGILGGTFDPVHVGHLIVAEAVRDHLALDRIILIPARQSPLKAHHPGAGSADRMAMLERAIAGNQHYSISTREIERTGQSYTVDTLRALQSETRADLYFLMGFDQLRDLPAWREPEAILRLAQIVGMSRPDYPEPDLSALAERYPAARERVTIVAVPLVALSSTEIRRRRAEGRSITFRVPRAVEEYIEERGLYAGKEKAGDP